MKIFVTGGNGFIGRHLLPALQGDIVAFGRTKPDGFSGEFIEGDLIQLDQIKSAITESSPDYVIHLAAKLWAKTDQEKLDLLKTNVLGTINMLESCSSGEDS